MDDKNKKQIFIIVIIIIILILVLLGLLLYAVWINNGFNSFINSSNLFLC